MARRLASYLAGIGVLGAIFVATVAEWREAHAAARPAPASAGWLATAPIQAEADWVEFEAGPATGRVRFVLTRSGLTARGEVVNRTDGPLWWRGPGLDCMGSHVLVEPQDVAGEPVGYAFSGVACTLEKRAPVSAEQGEAWRLAPGEAVPFAFDLVSMNEWGVADGAGTDGLGRLARVATAEEFCLPRATPPEHTLDFEQATIVFAWQREGRRAVWVDRSFDFALEHVDPFAERPYFRGATGVPMDVGPLRGEVDLVEDDGGVRVAWRLHNRSGEPLRFGVVDGPEWTWEVERAGQADLPASDWRLRGDGEIERRTGFDGEAPRWSSWAGGESRSGIFRVAGVSLAEGASWHLRIPVTWATRLDAKPVVTAWHVLYDARYGLDTAVVSPFANRGQDWRPYRPGRDRPDAASFDLNGNPSVAVLAGRTEVELTVRYRSDARIFARLHAYVGSGGRGPLQPVWIQRPGEPATEPDLPQAPVPGPNDALPRNAEFRYLVKSGDHGTVGTPGYSTARSKQRLDPIPPSKHPWQRLIPVAAPTTTPPRHDLDFPLVWVHVRYDPDHGLSASVWNRE